MTKSNYVFTLENLELEYLKALNAGYKIITCKEYFFNPSEFVNDKILINRIDIDYSISEAVEFDNIFKKLGINGSFFIRLHSKEYNPFSLENYQIVKGLIESGNEIGYHSEVIDQSSLWGEEEERCLMKDIEILNSMFDISVEGVASHGGNTGFNNLDFWKNRETNDFGLLYEAYDCFEDAFYISDSEWINWKCYDNGNLVKGDHRSLSEHISDDHFLIYFLIHTDTYSEYNVKNLA